MQTGITTVPPQPRPQPPGAIPEQIIYTLDQHDYVAHQMFLWDRDRGRSASRLDARRQWVGGMVGMSGALAAIWFSSAVQPTEFVLSDWLCNGACFLGLLLFLGLGRWIEESFRSGRAAYLRQMKEAATAFEREGELGRACIHWLLLDAEGLTAVSELERKHEGGSQRDYRESRFEWGMVNEVVVAEHHVFLLLADGFSWALPLSAFADRAAAAQFAANALAFARTGGPLVPKMSPEHAEGVRTALPV